jgi:opacity protein-like surface antigen
MLRRLGIVSAFLYLLNSQLAALGGSPGEGAEAGASAYESFFSAGRYEAGLTGGAFFSPFPPCANRPTINYSFPSLSLGYMLGDVKGDGWWRGNFELAGEAFGSSIFNGPGTYIAGGTLWLRYNFVPRRSGGIVPYVQAGGGAVSTDIDRGIVGQPFNFNLDAAAGVRYFFAQDWSVNLEYRYQHISNANTGPNNLGINSCGPFLGISHFF